MVATRLARALGCDDAEVGDVVYTALLQHLGCTAYAHETAEVWGDDIAFVRLAFLTDFADPQDVWRTWVSGLADSTGWSRPRVVAKALATGRRSEAEVHPRPARWPAMPRGGSACPSRCRQASSTPWRCGTARATRTPPATRSRCPPGSCTWPPSRCCSRSRPGPTRPSSRYGAARGLPRPPHLVDVLTEHATDILGDIDRIDAYDEVLACEPDPVRLVDEAQVEAVARTFGNLADLKSPWLQGHSAAVADLAAAAVQELGLDEHVQAVRVAGPCTTWVAWVSRAGSGTRPIR